MTRSPALLGLLGLSLFACTAKQTREAPLAPAPDARISAWVDAAGDRALITVVARPDAAAQLIAGLAPRVSRLDPEAGAQLADPMKALEAIAGPLPGWDRGQPLVAALFEPAFAAPAGAIAPQLPDARDPAHLPPALRHRILVPASDPPALTAALTAALTKAGWRAEGEALHLLPTVTARIFAEEGRVRIELATGGAPPGDWAIVGGPSARTPAHAALVAADGGPLRALLRPWHLRAVFTQRGAQQVAAALAAVSGDYVDAIAAAGAAEVMQAEALMYAERPEFDDWTLDLRGDAGALELRAVLSLTDVGAKLFEGHARAPLAPSGEPAVHIALGADLRAMIDRADRPAGYTDGVASDIGRRFAACGVGCSLHLLTRSPLGGLKLAASLDDDPVLALDIRAPQVAFFGMDGARPRLAVAFQVPAEADLGPVRAAVAGASLQPKPELWIRPTDGGQTVIVGMGVEQGVFGEPEARAPLARLALRADRLAKAPLEVAAVLGAVAGMEGRLDHAGGALIGRLLIGLDQPPSPPAAADPITTEYAGPLRAAPETDASACLRRAERGAFLALDAVSSAPPEMRGALMGAGLAEIEPELRCAEGDAGLKPAARGIRRLMLLTSAATELRGWNPQPAIERLQPLCAAGDAAVCARLKTVEARPVPKLARLTPLEPPVDGCPVTVEAGAAIRITADAIFVGETPLAEGDDGRVQLAALSEPVQVGVAADAPWARVKPTLAALDAAGISRITLVVREGDRVVGLPADLVGSPEARRDGPAPDPRAAPDRLAAPPRAPGRPLRLTVDDATFGGEVLDPAGLRAKRADAPGDGVDLYPADDVRWDRLMGFAAATCGGVGLGLGPPPATVDLWGPLPNLIDGRTLEGGLLGRGGPGGTGRLGGMGTVPGRKVDLGGQPDQLPAPVIKQTIRASHDAVRACYEAQLRLSPNLSGKMRVSFTIRPDGTTDAIERIDGMSDPTLWKCVRGVIDGMRFPEARGVTRVTYPFVFQTQ